MTKRGRKKEYRQCYETRQPGCSFFELNADGPDMLFGTGIKCP